ncbi:MAG: hypothetical protein U5K84_06545 [Alkalibacterium sp.]|nr:hypothetical protein [Alkalibacterium sp.]
MTIEIASKLAETSKRVNLYNSIEQLDVSDRIEEIVLVRAAEHDIERMVQKTKKHIRACP